MSAADPLQARYDETPYRDQVFPQLDASRLLGMAQLFQTAPAAAGANEPRVLDLACASGEHIRSQAERYPGVHFTGVDFSRREIERGRELASETGLGNVELIAADLREFEVEAGRYDLVLCHGAFSWVPDEVKQRIFEISRRGLRPAGLAVIAYLTYPGWKQREAIRELLAARVHGVDDPGERVRRSALVLRVLHAGYSAFEDSPHAQSLKDVVESMQHGSANVFLHDELGVDHDPCYFAQFADWASEYGLDYLAEADLATMTTALLPASAFRLLRELGPDFLETQQLIDFLVNRSGRTSLLVRDDAPVAREMSVDRLKTLHFTTAHKAATPAEASGESSAGFESPAGHVVHVGDVDTERLLSRLIEAEPVPVRFGDLESAEAGDGTADGLARSLLALLGRGLAEPRLPLG